MTTTQTQRWNPGPLHLILLLTIMQLLVTLLTNGFALSFDEAMWHYIGRNWFRHDLIPYAGGVDNKSPLIFAIFGLSDKLFGVNYWFPRVLGTICQSIGLYYVYKIAKYIAGKEAGMFTISFYGLALLWHGTGGKYVSYTETYAIMFVIIAFYRFVTAQNKSGFFISGFLAGIALGFRLTASFAILALFIASFRKSRFDTLMFCAGVISGILLLALIAFLAGIDLHNIYTYMLVDNFGSGSPTDHSLAWKLQNFSDKFVYSGMILFYPLALGYLFIKRKIDLFVLWLILAFIGINVIGIYDTVHLKEVLPALSLMSAFAVAHIVKVYKISLKPVFLVLWIVFLPNLFEPLSNLKRLLWGTNAQPAKYCAEPFIKPDEGDRKKLGWWVRANTVEQDRVFVAGFGAQVQAYSERISPTIYFNVTQTQIAKERFFKDMQQNEPAMILVPLFPEYEQFVEDDMKQFVANLIAKDYYLDRCLYNYNVYRKGRK
jgi:hypothetical protein